MREHLSRGNVAGRLEGKVALITGASSGQGRETALLFARAGAVVIGCGIDQPGLDETVAFARREGMSVQMDFVDAADLDAVRAWVEKVVRDHGGIDILYNNAAFAHFAPLAEMTVAQWRETLRLELDIVFIPTQVAWPHLVARGGGSIINIASVSGMRGTDAVGGFSAVAHAAGKGGVIGLTNQLAVEGAPHWIRVNTISPSTIVTPAAQAFVDADPIFKRFFEGISALPRVGWPVDVAYAGVFLASDEANYITGANITVDGGSACKVGISVFDT